ncbi:hypothetical protein QPK87_31165 [Kamptonema cortianum]|nr:hypothetical protein [Geitlerinema splendidum]MDK3160986.1 hypothetical protein [Kamptonema cortianum]
MDEQVVNRIVDRDSKGLKIFFLVFFLATPLLGVLWFWSDGHNRLKNEASRFAETRLRVAMTTWEQDLWFDISTPTFADQVRTGQVRSWSDRFGSLQEMSRVTAEKTRAREESDQGVLYAEISFQAKCAKGTADVMATITRKSIETDWYVLTMDMRPAK